MVSPGSLDGTRIGPGALDKKEGGSSRRGALGIAVSEGIREDGTSKRDCYCLLAKLERHALFVP